MSPSDSTPRTRRRSGAALALGAGFAGLLWLVGCDASVDQPAAKLTLVAARQSIAPASRQRPPRQVGVGSCTAGGCHGSGSPGSVEGSEYNIWISQDPHADAFSVLYDQVSLDMVRRLDGKPADAPVAPYQDERCLGCHSSKSVAPPRDETASHYSDGVSCEACHGPAEGWLSTHYSPAYRDSAGNPDAARLHRQGMWNTDDLAERARICATCHVGDEGRDVNHDLIAAGHPRLQFDFAAYYRRLPVHWNPADDRQAWGDNLDAMMWAVGQSVNSSAALRRLAARAQGDGPWPELAEWSCGACHHDLRDDEARQRLLADRDALAGLDFAWDDWHHQLPRAYLEAVAKAWRLDPQVAGDIPQEMAGLADLVGDLRSDRRAVGEQAVALSAKLDRWTDAVARARPTPAELTHLSRDLATIHLDGRLTTWSEAALAYDALASLHQSRLRAARSARRSDPAHSRVTTAIGELYGELSRARRERPYLYLPEVSVEVLERIRRALGEEVARP